MKNKALPLFWLLIDQAIFALSNFVVNVQFARWLSPREYGMFAISFSGFLLLSVVHYGCLLEPVLVLSAQTEADCRRSFVTALMRLHLLLLGGTVSLCGLAFLIAWWFGEADIGWLVVGSGIGGMANLALLTARRICLVFLSTRTSAIVGIAYFIGVIATGYACAQQWSISWLVTWEIIGGWSLICAGIIFCLLYRRLEGNRPFMLPEILKFQARYAPLALVAGLGAWATSESIFVVLAKIRGLEAVAATRVVFNLGNPLTQVAVAINVFSLVGLSTKHAHGKPHDIVGNVLPFLVICALAATFLGLAGHSLIDFLYRGKYVSAAPQLPIFCASIGMSALTQIAANSFKARGLLLRGNLPQIVCGLATLTISIQLIRTFGQPGAVYANCIGNAVGMCVAMVLFVSAQPVAKPVSARTDAR